MADITMCTNENCSLADNCYRFTAPPSRYQSYMMIEKEVEDKSECEYYWEVKE